MKTLKISAGYAYTDVDGNICTITGRHFDDFSVSISTVDDDGYERPTGKTGIVTSADIRHAIRAFSGDVYDRVQWDDAEPKRSETIESNRHVIASHMEKLYRSVLESRGKIQYKIYIWENGEIQTLEQAQGDNGFLQAKDCIDEKLFYVCTIASPFFDAWDCVDHSAPEDDDAREQEEAEIIDWCVDEYSRTIDDVIDTIVQEAQWDEDE